MEQPPHTLAMTAPFAPHPAATHAAPEASHSPPAPDALPSVLVVDGGAPTAQAVARALADTAFVRHAPDAAQALALAQHTLPDLIVLDMGMAQGQPLNTLRDLKADIHLADVPVLVVLGSHDGALEVAALQAGAADLIHAPLNALLLQARLGTQLRLKAATDELKRLSTVDALTGLSNQRALEAALRRVISLAQRNATPLSLMVVQIDHFARLQTRHGPAVALDGLKQVATALSQISFRPHDQAFRFTGETFAVLLPGTDLEGATLLAQRLMAQMDDLALPHADSPTASVVTLSCGLCVAAPSDLPAGPVHQTALSLLQAADEALQAALRQGAGHVRWVRGTGGDAPIALWPEAPRYRAPGWPIQA